MQVAVVAVQGRQALLVLAVTAAVVLVVTQIVQAQQAQQTLVAAAVLVRTLVRCRLLAALAVQVLLSLTQE
tara:strand:- start:94 stop:306 length:213 start_codon:yes stop_codon:yes gene_type:complete